ncbi:MAG: putative toxin-antitoxin system toxin component, PIN family [Syntrophorhabdaceae bacterium]|nr:putative toxin-antitoxin system toxin component, PIN family [Syntrophorhabdaceae bacterium]
MIRVVLDTNVIVSAYLTRNSKAEKILSLAGMGVIDIFLSGHILVELERTLLSPKLTRIHRDTARQIRHSIELLKRFVTITPGVIEVDAVKDDPDDNKILACAIEAHADFIISGDHHLTDLRRYKDIPIVNPDTFLKHMENQA